MVTSCSVVLLTGRVVELIISGFTEGGEGVVFCVVLVARLPVSVSPKPRLCRLQNMPVSYK